MYQSLYVKVRLPNTELRYRKCQTTRRCTVIDKSIRLDKRNSFCQIQMFLSFLSLTKWTFFLLFCICDLTLMELLKLEALYFFCFEMGIHISVNSVSYPGIFTVTVFSSHHLKLSFVIYRLKSNLEETLLERGHPCILLNR